LDGKRGVKHCFTAANLSNMIFNANCTRERERRERGEREEREGGGATTLYP